MTDRIAQLEKAKTKIEALSTATGPGSDQKVRTETIRELVRVIGPRAKNPTESFRLLALELIEDEIRRQGAHPER